MQAEAGDRPASCSRTARLRAAVGALLNGASSGARKIDSPAATPIDLLDAAGGSMLRRALPAVGVVVLLLLILRALRRRSS